MGNLCCQFYSNQQSGNQVQIPKIEHEKNQQVQLYNQNNIGNLIKTKSTETNNQNMRLTTILLPDGSKYVGPTRNGVPDGRGQQLHENGDIFTGTFVNGVKLSGQYKFANGIIYDGQFIEDQMQGKGRMTFPNGDWYEGQFKNNLFDGLGRFYSKANQSYYQGSYQKGKKHGYGKVLANELQLDGYWSWGQFKGKHFS